MNASSRVRAAFAIALGVVTSAAQGQPATDVTVPVPVVVNVAQPVELTVEWLALNAAGQQVLESRKEIVEKQINLQVSPRSDRFVRFSRPGTSPVTMPAARLVGPTPWQLPDPRAGGELFALIDTASVMPIAYRINGANMRTIDRAGDSRGNSDIDGYDPQSSTLFARGLAAGAHEIVPVYQGGLTGVPIPIVIKPTKSTVVRLQPEDVGEVAVTAPPASCESARVFGLSSVTEGPYGTHRESVFQTADIAACQWTVAGLKAGRYDASLRGPGSGAGSEGIDIPAQGRVSVVLAAATVNVTGRVTYGDDPAADLKLLFTQAKSGFSALAVTDSDGHYTIAVDRPGDYRVMLLDDAKHVMRSAHVVTGDNTVNFNIKRAASLRVRVRNRQANDKTSIEIRRKDVSQFVSTKSLKYDLPEAKFEAIEFGSYEVYASQEDLSSEVKTVVIDEAHPAATVDLTLHESQATLTLRDDTGMPVQNARFHALYPEPPEVSPGVYELRGVAGRNTLRVRATSGVLVPICRVAPRNQSMEMVMATGRAVMLQLPEEVKSLSDDAGILTGLAGSDCPVPLADFASTPLESDTPTGSRFLITNFPRDARVTFINRRGEHTLVAGPDGVVTVQSSSAPFIP